MVPVPPAAAGPSVPAEQVWPRALLGAATVGGLVAVAAVYAYYHQPWQPLAHSLGLWAALAGLLGLGRTPVLAVGRATVSLAAAVVTFFVGVKVGHDIRWGDTSSVAWVDWDRIGVWLVLAVFAGTALGLAGSRATRTDWRGAAAAAALAGLPLGDAAARLYLTGTPDAAVCVNGLVALVAYLCAIDRNRRPALTLAWTGGVTAVGFVALSVPDAMGLY